MPKLDRGREIAKPRRRRELRAPKREVSRFRRILRWLRPSRPLDAFAVLIALGFSSAFLVNALALQTPPQVAGAPKHVTALDSTQFVARPTGTSASVPAPSAAPAPAPVPRPAAGKPGLVLDIQRALAERGYYDGDLDGLMGPRTQQAIREFEEAQSIAPTGQPSEALLARVLQARARSDVTGSIPGATPPAVPAAAQPSPRVFAVQRVLSRLGYGPVGLTGLSDAATQDAIKEFESDRGLKPTGEIGDRLLRELSAVTGAPVE